MRHLLFASALLFVTSQALAQAPSPAQMGITPSTLPEVLQVLDNGSPRTWVPIGSVDPTSHTFTPVGGGGPIGGNTVLGNSTGSTAPPSPIAMPSCSSSSSALQWLTGTGFGCALISGGGGGGGTVTTFPTHAALIAGTTAFGTQTLYQAGFYTAGAGGAAFYDWNASSYCPGGTSGSPTAADGVTCILPGGSSSSPGRYLLNIPSGQLDVQTIGMKPGNFDNSPLVPTLMNMIGPASPYSGAGGGEIVFTPVLGQDFTAYYFATASFSITRAANFRCNGKAVATYPGVQLVFAAGLHGVIQEDGHYTGAGNPFGSGVFEGCSIFSMGKGNGLATQGATSVTAVNMSGLVPNNTVIPLTQWGPGDGIIVTPFKSYPNSPAAAPAVAPGAYVDPSYVSGTTLPLASGYNISPLLQGFATAIFVETGAANFNNNDAIHVGNTTLTAVTGTPTAGQFQIGANFAASAANLVALLNGTGGANTTAAFYADPHTLLNNAIVFTATVSGSGSGQNAYVSTYTPAGSFAGSFTPLAAPAGTSGAVFSGGAATSNSVVLFRLPAALAFTVQTTLGSNSVVVTAGPRPLIPGDVVWSDAFPMWTTVQSVTGTWAFPETVLMGNAFMQNSQNALVAHSSGAPGQLWVVPAGLKRDTTSSSLNLYISGFGAAFEESCQFTASNCTTSYDERNSYTNSMIGRYDTGDNTSGVSISEEASANYIADLVAGGAVGSTYISFNSNSVDASNANYPIMGNCANGGSSTLIGGYITILGAGSNGGCAAQVGLIPPLSGSPFVTVGPTNQAVTGGSSIYNGSFQGPWKFINQINGSCVLTNSTTFTVALGTIPCGTNQLWQWTFNSTTNAWSNLFANNLGYNMETMFTGTVGGGITTYTGYAGNTNTAYKSFPNGVFLDSYEDIGNEPANHRLLDSRASNPTTLAYDKQGNLSLNRNASPGGVAGWIATGTGTGTRYPTGPIANDTAGTTWTLGNYLTLTPVALASLPATCTAGTFGVINNGVASPTYNAAVGSTTGAATDPVFCANGNVWTYH